MLDLTPWSRPRDPAARPPLVLGTMNFGKRTPEREATAIIERALAAGVVHFDTANAYCDGESERILGRALGPVRDRVVVATKVGFGRTRGAPEGLSKARVLAACDESLSRLGMDHVDVYYLHVPDHVTPMGETLDAVEQLLAAGKIRAFAVSNYASWQILETMHLCDARGLPRPILSQVLYNLLIRQLDVEYARFAHRYPIATVVYNALAGGLLSGRHEKGAPPEGSRFHKNPLYLGRYWTDRLFDLTESYKAVAAEAGMSLVDLSYAFLASAPLVDAILVGPATAEQLDAAVSGCARVLPPEVRARIDELHRAFVGTATSYAR